MKETVNGERVTSNDPVGTRFDDEDDVPLSERGKEEKMTIDEREPGFAFGLVSATYLVLLLLALITAIVAILL